MKRSQSWPKSTAKDEKIIRQPAVAGIFYPEEKRSLADLIDRLTQRKVPAERAVAAVVPHAGYLYSGSVAAAVYSRIPWPILPVVVGPNHTGAGGPLSIMTRGSWMTPFGKMGIDEELARGILSATLRFLKEDPDAHQDEHSVEVQVPFLQRVGKVEAFVPIVLRPTDLSTVRQLGAGIAEAVQRVGKRVLLFASTDFTHYEPLEVVKAKDRRAIDRILSLDEEGLLNTVERQGVTMCGDSATAVVIAAAKRLGAKEGTLVKYQTSGETSGDVTSVVGYAGILIR